jgi:uncharacterized caspase-like protein
MRFLTAFAILTAALNAQPRRDLQLEVNGRSLALVVGNQAYPKWPLTNPVNDARAMAATLTSVGFEVEKVDNANLKQFEQAIDRFIAKIRKNDVAMFYYAGHGIQIGGENYLVPVDFDARDEADAKYVSYSASRLQERMDLAGARLNIVVLDACRNNPFRPTRGGSGGLAAMSTGKGTLIAFATAPGKTADDNPSGGNGLFTSHLIKTLQEPGLSLDQVFNRVREGVYADSQERQLPWTVSSVIGEYYFRPPAAGGNQNPLARQQLAPTAPPPNPLARAANPAPARVDPSASLPGAQQAFDRGDTEEAIRAATEILRSDPSHREALRILALSQFRKGDFDLFEATGAQALAAGAILKLTLGHHHTLTGGHFATVTLGGGKFAFEAAPGSQCNQKPFELPLVNLVEVKVQNSNQGEVFLNVRIRDEENKVKNLNFAHPDSKIDSSNGLPRLVSPQNSPRMLGSVATVLRKGAAAAK